MVELSAVRIWNNLVLVFSCQIWSGIRSLREVSKYKVFSGPYFPVFGPEKIPYSDTFDAVNVLLHDLKHDVLKHDLLIVIYCLSK